MTSPFSTSPAPPVLSKQREAERPRAEAIVSAIDHTVRIATKAALFHLETCMEARSSGLEARVYRTLRLQGKGHRGHPHHLVAACVAVPSGLTPA